MYTYNLSKRLCEILNTEFIENPSISDQMLSEVPQHEIKSTRGTRQPNIYGELNPFYGKTHSLEVRKKISQTQKTRTRNPHSTETRRKIGEANKRRVISEETRNKMRESAKLRWGREFSPPTIII
jgi:hypothetical protein